MTRKHTASICAALFLSASAALLLPFGRPLWQPLYTKLAGGRTVEQAVDRYAPNAEARLRPRFHAVQVAYPPDELALVGLKEEKTLELWARNRDCGQGWVRIHRYDVRAASGVAGPKLREGDKQVPEGVYRVESLNPNSRYHLSMKLDYPNAFDRARAEEDGRDKPGTNIFIHGKAASVGCLAMGDEAIEELFVLVHKAGLDNVSVLLLPHDPADKPLTPSESMPGWTAELYQHLDAQARDLRDSATP
ncbi:MAG: murein L,D-transpeptidase family protein [Phycisphaeraceae bacterium]